MKDRITISIHSSTAQQLKKTVPEGDKRGWDAIIQELLQKVTPKVTSKVTPGGAKGGSPESPRGDTVNSMIADLATKEELTSLKATFNQVLTNLVKDNNLKELRK